MKKRIGMFFVGLVVACVGVIWVGCSLPGNKPLVEVFLVTPAQGEEDVGLHPDFSWEVQLAPGAARDASFFKVFVAPLGEAFGESMETQQNAIPWNSELLAGTQYHWKVECWQNDRFLASSEEWNFSTQPYYTVEVRVASAQGGQIRSEASDWGETILIQAGLDTPTRLWAQAQKNYQLEGWFIGEQLLSLDNPFDYLPEHPAATSRELESDIQLEVRFSKRECAITVQASPSEHGSVRVNEGEWGDSASQTLQVGDEVRVEAQAQGDFHFAGWFEESPSGSRGTKLSEENPYVFQAQGDQSLRAAFEKDTFTVTVQAFPATKGNVRVNHGPWQSVQQLPFPAGEQLEVKALAAGEALFVGWFENEQKLSDDNPYHFTLQGDRELEGRFEEGYPSWMALVGGRSFLRGNTRSDAPVYWDEVPTHTVTLGYDFLVGKTEVTFNQYDAYCEATGKPKPDDAGFGRQSYPVINVSWWDAVAFCNWMSQHEGLPVAYGHQGEANEGRLLDASGKVTTDIRKVKGYRLLTEAEWEYVARGGHVDIVDGVETHDYKFAGSNDLDLVGWYSDNGENQPHPVGQKGANELGLYDMSGNVYEWCHDWYEDSWYQHGNQINPIGPGSSTNDWRVIRGGGWAYGEGFARVADRGICTPIWYFAFLGFRVARTY
ncbi:MAG TPA: SUMF1/EgtB/PvdO family nonheme iron enzyme [Thermotogota bacterium]|nr:SUMF1/EgtB/PvdO family nonheme iron enzyme [Thermotogota bacterium]HRW93323.1 SUMF1/EgtB/PvdO family nonheme iron enzyme [Thermotogota bacterium]HRW93346.1 SUMF1/EgtB/PvdO family nonheme iron enzyme [Thermotogota bacterium]